MADTTDRNETRARLGVAGISAADLAWLGEIGWNAGNIKPIANEAQAADHVRREAVLNASIAHLTFPERANSDEGKIAAQIGAKLADWRERDETDD